MELFWLKSDEQKFLFGDKPSIADLSSASEIVELIPLREDVFAKVPRLKKWVLRVISLPEAAEVQAKIMEKRKKAYEKLDLEREKRFTKL